VRVYSARYSFRQRFVVPAREAFKWSTDYQSGDFALMGVSGKRRIRRINEDTVLLTETTRSSGKKIVKTKLVRINEADLSWVNTHIAGPHRHSQFIYRIIPQGRTSSLHFRGLLLCYSDNPISSERLRKIALNERRDDSQVWRNLAKAMAKEIGPEFRRRP
jgi:hypothetical protein